MSQAAFPHHRGLPSFTVSSSSPAPFDLARACQPVEEVSSLDEEEDGEVTACPQHHGSGRRIRTRTRRVPSIDAAPPSSLLPESNQPDFSLSANFLILRKRRLDTRAILVEGGQPSCLHLPPRPHQANNLIDCVLVTPGDQELLLPPLLPCLPIFCAILGLLICSRRSRETDYSSRDSLISLLLIFHLIPFLGGVFPTAPPRPPAHMHAPVQSSADSRTERRLRRVPLLPSPLI